jgi:predicted acetyltransferase
MLLRLRPPAIEDEAEVRAAHAELLDERFLFLLHWEPERCWRDYVEELERRRRGIAVPAELVPATFLLADVEGALVGRVSIRHELNDFLLREGGHIGYCVRRAHRRRGYATEILRQSLIIARAQGVRDVMVACDVGNIASQAVIERLGGELEDVRVGGDGIAKRRYWIR